MEMAAQALLSVLNGLAVDFVIDKRKRVTDFSDAGSAGHRVR
jgi:hypothetical protein